MHPAVTAFNTRSWSHLRDDNTVRASAYCTAPYTLPYPDILHLYRHFCPCHFLLLFFLSFFCFTSVDRHCLFLWPRRFLHLPFLLCFAFYLFQFSVYCCRSCMSRALHIAPYLLLFFVFLTLRETGSTCGFVVASSYTDRRYRGQKDGHYIFLHIRGHWMVMETRHSI